MNLTRFAALFFAVVVQSKLNQPTSFAEQVSFLEGDRADVYSDAELAPSAGAQRGNDSAREDRDKKAESFLENDDTLIVPDTPQFPTPPPTENEAEAEETVESVSQRTVIMSPLMPEWMGCDCLPDGDFAIKTHWNKYVTAEWDGDVDGREPNLGSWEKFHGVRTGRNCKVGLRSNANSEKYLRCPGNGDHVDQASKMRSYETWRLICLDDGKVAFKGHRGYMCAANNPYRIECDRSQLGSWEKFEIETDF